jgi:hypothetical protein
MSHGAVIVAQGGPGSHGVPAAMRHPGLDPLTSRRPATQRRHIGFGPDLVDEYQAGGVDPLAVFGPLYPPTGNIGRFWLGGNQRLFCD